MHLFNGKKFYDVAIQLMNFSDDEEFQRSAISRFYYACFWESNKYYEKAFKRYLPFEHKHQTLIDELMKSNYEMEQDLGAYLKKLRQYRVHADYKDKLLRNNMLRNSKRTTEDIFDILNELNSNPVRRFI